MGYVPIGFTSAYDINLILRKTRFICDVMEKYTTHNLNNSDIWLVELAVTMKMVMAPTNTQTARELALPLNSSIVKVMFTTEQP